jgi:F0F1-type ATP synthase gamma subunit
MPLPNCSNNSFTISPIKSDVPVTAGDYIFEPSKEEIVLTLIPKSLKTQLYKGIRDSFASEHESTYDCNAQSNG